MFNKSIKNTAVAGKLIYTLVWKVNTWCKLHGCHNITNQNIGQFSLQIIYPSPKLAIYIYIFTELKYCQNELTLTCT